MPERERTEPTANEPKSRRGRRPCRMFLCRRVIPDEPGGVSNLIPVETGSAVRALRQAALKRPPAEYAIVTVRDTFRIVIQEVTLFEPIKDLKPARETKPAKDAEAT